MSDNRKTFSVTKLDGNPSNPRTITVEQASALAESLKAFGDLGGICKGVMSGKLIGGHQRVEAFKADAKATVYITERLRQPDACGTVAYGYVETNGTRYSYREVSWDQDKETAAMLAANRHGGNWDFTKLNALLKDMSGPDRLLAGFSLDEVNQMLGLGGSSPGAGEAIRKTLAERFGVPPFSVLDARQGYWQERKRAWIGLGIKSEVGRGGGLLMTSDRVTTENLDYYRHRNSPGGSPRPACDYSKQERGDGRGQPLKQ